MIIRCRDLIASDANLYVTTHGKVSRFSISRIGITWKSTAHRQVEFQSLTAGGDCSCHQLGFLNSVAQSARKAGLVRESHKRTSLVSTA